MSSYTYVNRLAKRMVYRLAYPTDVLRYSFLSEILKRIGEVSIDESWRISIRA